MPLVIWSENPYPQLVIFWTRALASLLFIKHSLGVKLGATKNKSSEQQGKELNLGLQEYKSSALTSPKNVSNNAGKIHVNVTCTIIFNTFQKKNGIYLSFSTVIFLYLIITDRSCHQKFYNRSPKNFYFCLYEVASLKKVQTNPACCPLHPNFWCLSHLSIIIIITSICL